MKLYKISFSKRSEVKVNLPKGKRKRKREVKNKS